MSGEPTNLEPLGAGQTPAGGLMAGKKGLVMGLANDKSIAWGISQALRAQGADFAISYQGGDTERASSHLEQAIQRFEDNRARHLVGASAIRLGRLVGGQRGTELCHHGQNLLDECGIKSAAHMLDVLVPGFSPESR